MSEQEVVSIVYWDATHLRKGTPAYENFLTQLAGAKLAGIAFSPVLASNSFWMLVKQQLLLPMLAILRPRARFVFAGRPPSPFFALFPRRAVFHVSDTFFLTRPSDAGTLAHAFWAPQLALALRRISQFLVPCEKTASDLKWYTRHTSRIRLYRPAVAEPVADLELFDRVPLIPPRPLKLVTAGPIEPRKNFDVMIAIFKEIKGSFDRNAELHIIGASDERNADIAAHQGVVMHGNLPLDGRRRVFESTDIYLSTSHDEGEFWALLEAQASGLAVVAPDRALFQEIIADAGLFFNPLLPLQAVSIIQSIVTTHGWRQKHALAARENVRRWNDLAAKDVAELGAMFAADQARLSGSTVTVVRN